MQVIMQIVLGLPGPLSWADLAIAALLVVVVILMAVVRRQRTRYASLRESAGALANEIDGLDTEFAKLVEQILQARDQFGVPTMVRPGSASERQTHNPQQLSFWQEFMKRAYELVLMLTGRFRNGSTVPATPADLKLRLAIFRQRLRSEANNIRQLAEYVSTHDKTRSAPGLNTEFEEADAATDAAGSNSVAESLEHAPMHQDERRSPGAATSENTFAHETAGTGSSLLQLYNQAVIDNQAREEFRERFKPIRIGTVNAVERRQNPTVSLAPEFKEASDGDFFAVPLDGETGYAVVPRLGLTIGAVSYNAGGLGEIFANPAHDSARSYSRYSVLEPAIFRHDNNRWVKVKSGELNLGPPD